MKRTSPRDRAFLRGVAITCALPLAACAGGEAAWQGTVTDSAGVEVVTSPPEGLWGATSSWRLEEEFRVGGLNPEMGVQPGAEFGQVVGVDVDAAGHVYVADQQAAAIQVFTPDGSWSHQIGQPGAGPGEIGRALAGVFVMGTEVWVADVANLRVNRYAPDGESLGSEPLDFTRGVPIRWDRVGDRLVVQMRSMGALGMAETESGGDPLVTFGTEVQDTLLVLPEGMSLEVDGGRPRFEIFASEPVWDAAPDGRLIAARNSAYRIEVRDASGVVTRVVQKDVERRPVTESDQTRLKDAIRRLMTEQGAPPPAVEQFMAGMAFAAEYPAFAQVLAGPEGTLWVQHIRTADDVGGDGEFNPQDLGADTWDVFREDGRFLGTLELPERFTPLRVEGDAFWGVQRDDFDVNSVVRFRLVRE